MCIRDSSHPSRAVRIIFSLSLRAYTMTSPRRSSASSQPQQTRGRASSRTLGKGKGKRPARVAASRLSSSAPPRKRNAHGLSKTRLSKVRNRLSILTRVFLSLARRSSGYVVLVSARPIGIVERGASVPSSVDMVVLFHLHCSSHFCFVVVAVGFGSPASSSGLLKGIHGI